MTELEAECLDDLAVGRESLANLESFYGKWAEKYDGIFISVLTAGNKHIAGLLCNYLSRKTDSVILDVLCGTGFTGLQLHSTGFKNIDGADFSDDMIKQAKQKGIYRHLFKDCLTETSGLSCEDEIYDAFVSCFGLTQGHMELSSAMREALRVVKNSGMIVMGINANLGRKKILNEITRLVNEDKVLLKYFENRFYYEVGNVKHDGYFCVLEKT